MDRAINIGLDIQEKTGKSLKNFVMEFADNEKLNLLKREINMFASGFEFYTA